MPRKWMVLTAIAVAVTGLTVGIPVAADEDSPLHKLMEKVQSSNGAITKGVRNEANFKKSQKAVVTAAEKLVELGKQAHDMKDPAKKAKDVPDAVSKWDALMDAMIVSSENLAKVAGKSSATFDEAKKAHVAVKNSCSECHKVFRKEDEGF